MLGLSDRINDYSIFYSRDNNKNGRHRPVRSSTDIYTTCWWGSIKIKQKPTIKKLRIACRSFLNIYVISRIVCYEVTVSNFAGKSRWGQYVYQECDLVGYLGSARKKTWTQSDIRFCENEGSNRFKINEKGGHFDRKYKRKFIQNA